MSGKIAWNKAVLHTIEYATENFANDMGFYPDSAPRYKLERNGKNNPSVTPDQGAHRLFESLFGLDYLGYQRDHYYAFDSKLQIPIDSNGEKTNRWGPYVKREDLNIGTMQDAHPEGVNFISGNDNPVIMDMYFEPPRAVLYYKANWEGKIIRERYSYEDNAAITTDMTIDGRSIHPHFDTPEEFYEYIRDPKTDQKAPRPYNADSFLLIMAGRDREYGTEDDITIFR